MAPALAALWRSVTPADIDTTLPDLWRDAARDSPVSRALMSNLVIVRHGARPPDDEVVHLEAESNIVRIAERHPARIIVLNYSPDAGRACAPRQATIGVLTFGAGAVRYGVEVIAVDEVCAEASVPSIVRRLTRGDVPTTVWWTADLSRARPPDPMVETGRQFLYDSTGWAEVRLGAARATAILALPHAPDLADLNWQRLAPLRSAIVHGLRNELGAGAPVQNGVMIRHRAGEPAAGWLLGAWLRRALRWTSFPSIEASSNDDEVVTVTLAGERWEMTARMNSQRVLVAGTGEPPPFSIPVPRQTVADEVISELRSLGRDMHLRETMLTLAT
ncbi:MAG: hypothetical protein GEU82_00425 [Luteitalea sp.]|nr:hypothetical protein [Luteitalea sp.]